MIRSLQQCFSQQDRIIGTGTKTDGPEKLVVSPNSGKRMVVPGHVHDVAFRDDVSVVEPDLNRITGPGSNWNRYNIRIIRKRNRIYPAVPHQEPSRRVVRQG